MLDSTPRGGHPLPPYFHDVGVQHRAWAVADRWVDYLAARDAVDVAAGRISRLVSVLGRFAVPPVSIARRLRAASIALLQAWSAAAMAKLAYSRAAIILHVATRWRGADDDAAFGRRAQYAVSLATAFAAARFTEVRL